MAFRPVGFLEFLSDSQCYAENEILKKKAIKFNSIVT